MLNSRRVCLFMINMFKRELKSSTITFLAKFFIILEKPADLPFNLYVMFKLSRQIKIFIKTLSQLS